MAVSGLVAVGVTDADVVAVLALAPDLLDDAAAGRHDGRAYRAGPIDARVHLGHLQDGMAPHTEAGGNAHVFSAHGAAHQELARGIALLVEVVDDAVGGAETVEPVRLAGRRDGGGEQLAQAAVDAPVVVLDVEEEFEAVAGAHPLAEIRLVRVDLEDLHDDVGGYALPLCRVVQAGVQARSLWLVVVGNLGPEGTFVDGGGAGDEFAGCAARHRHLVVMALAEHAEADRLHPVGPDHRRHERDVHFLAGQQRTFRQRVARRVRHGAGLPGFGPQAQQGASQGVAALSLDHAHLASREVVGRVLLQHRLGQDGRVGRGWLGRTLGRHECIAGSGALRVGREARPQLGRLLGGRLHAARHIGDFFRAELLAVLARDHAAQQLHDLDHGILLAVLGWLRGVERRGVGVELERVQRRNVLGLHLGDRGKARDQACIRLVEDVVAGSPPLPHRVENDEFRRHGPARDHQPVGLRDCPAQPVDARGREPERGERRVTHPLQIGQHAAVRLRRVGRAGDHDQDGDDADRRGQAGAHQPAEASALARIGVIADVNVAEWAAGAAEMGMRAAVRLTQPKMGASATQRCVALGVHPPCRSPFARRRWRTSHPRRAATAPNTCCPARVAERCTTPGAPRDAPRG